SVNAADGEEGHPRAVRRKPDQLQPHWRASGLGGRLMDRADPNVVGAVRPQHLLFGVRREAHEPLGTDGLPGAENWCVVLPQVNAVGVCLDRELGAVVEQKQRPVLGADPLEARGGGEDLRFSAMLDPQLDEARAWWCWSEAAPGAEPPMSPRECSRPSPRPTPKRSHCCGSESTAHATTRSSSPSCGSGQGSIPAISDAGRLWSRATGTRPSPLSASITSDSAWICRSR